MYEALTTRPVFKPALSHDEAVRIMSTEEKHHLDPKIWEVFTELLDEFRLLDDAFSSTSKIGVQSSLRMTMSSLGPCIPLNGVA